LLDIAVQNRLNLLGNLITRLGIGQPE